MRLLSYIGVNPTWRGSRDSSSAVVGIHVLIGFLGVSSIARWRAVLNTGHSNRAFPEDSSLRATERPQQIVRTQSLVEEYPRRWHVAPNETA